MRRDCNRRTVLAGIGAGAATLSFAGVVSADSSARYLVRLGNPDRERAIRHDGFSVENRLADGSVLIVTGPADAVGDLESIRGVTGAVPDFRFELEVPAQSEPADASPGGDDDGHGNGNGRGNGRGAGATGDETDADGPELFDQQWDKHVTDVERAHERATGDGRRVAIIDTGVDHTHQDLANVNVDASASIIDGEVSEHVGDIGDHGTHVAGIAAATGAVGVLGTAPDAEIVSLRVFAGDGGAAFSDILLAMEYAAALEADAANMSIGTSPIPPQENAAQYRRIMEPVAQSVASSGTLLVGSAGNDDANLQQEGRFTLPNSLAGVTSISATAPSDERAFYSNYGSNEIDLGAPGGGAAAEEETVMEDLVLSTVPGDEYAWFAGTSMAAPQVAGAAALVRERAPDATARQVERALKAGADLVTGESDADLGAGRLNAADAIDAE